jgi:uncharacterized SAM-binding protein YcdF (DUF218 family)
VATEERTSKETGVGRAGHSSGWRQAISGMVLGVLTWLTAAELIESVFPYLFSGYVVLLIGFGAAAAGRSRARFLLWGAAALTAASVVVVGYTPLAGRLMRGILRGDPLRPAPAVVVLASDNEQGLTISDYAQERLLHGYEVLRQGYAPVLVLSRGTGRRPSWVPAAREQMRLLGLDYPVLETEPVEDTHDEALAVARMARQRRWETVILATHPWHMRRASAVFEKAGVHVICSPCAERRYNVKGPQGMFFRLPAFRDWLHEVIGYQVYRWRGWI